MAENWVPTLETFEMTLRRRLERLYGMLLIICPAFIWLIVSFFRKEHVDYASLLIMVYLSVISGLFILLIHWQKFHVNIFLLVSVASIILTARLISITGPDHNPFTHLFYPILLASAIYYRESGTFAVLTMVLVTHTLCIVYGLKHDTMDEFLLNCFAYIVVTWVTYLCKQTLMKLKENEVAIEVAGGIAHELSQPLLVIEGTAAQLQSNKAEDETALKAAGTIRSQAQRMQKSLQQLQQITQYRAKKYVSGMKIMDLERSSSDAKK